MYATFKRLPLLPILLLALPLLALGLATAPARAQTFPAGARPAPWPAFGMATADPWDACGAQTSRIEREQGIPAGLLTAISLVESGRWNKARKASLAWPWTIYADGQGMVFPTKAAAIAKARQLLAQGNSLIDVGCMQIDLYHHPDAFANLEQAFDPAANVAYAARFLKGLFAETHDWTAASAAYHSRSPAFAAPYRQKVVEAWNALQHGGMTLAAYTTFQRGQATWRRQEALRLAAHRAQLAAARAQAQSYRARMLAAWWARKHAEEAATPPLPGQIAPVPAAAPVQAAQPLPLAQRQPPYLTPVSYRPPVPASPGASSQGRRQE